MYKPERDRNDDVVLTLQQRYQISPYTYDYRNPYFDLFSYRGIVQIKSAIFLLNVFSLKLSI